LGEKSEEVGKGENIIRNTGPVRKNSYSRTSKVKGGHRVKKWEEGIRAGGGRKVIVIRFQKEKKNIWEIKGGRFLKKDGR